MSTISVSLFGRLFVSQGEHKTNTTSVNKAWELLCYLLIHRDHPQSRESLASMLWGDCSTTQSKKYLRQTLWQLQTLLGVQRDPGEEPLLLIEPDWIMLNACADFWLDIAVFEEAFELTQGFAGRDLDPAQASALERGVRLYKGDLLEGWYQEWCLFERERYQNMYIGLLEKLMDYCEGRHDYENGLEYGARILRFDPARECTSRRQMRLHYLAGDRTGALRQYQRCATALEAELGVKPDKHTKALYEQIRADELAYSNISHSPTAAARIDVLQTLLGHLKQLSCTLSSLENQVRREISLERNPDSSG